MQYITNTFITLNSVVAEVHTLIKNVFRLVIDSLISRCAQTLFITSSRIFLYQNLTLF